MVEKTKGAAINLDSILTELGQFGKYQFMNYMLLVVPVMFAAANNGNYIFTAANTNYRCLIPECDYNPYMKYPPLETEWLSYAMPNSNDPRRCIRYDIANNTLTDFEKCVPELFDKNKIIDCDEFVFDNNYSLIKELNIQCEAWKRTLVGTVHSVGQLLALPLVGFISDRYGRKLAFILSSFLAGVFGFCRSFTTNYYTFLFFEFLEPFLGSGVYSSAFILGMELVGPKRRVLGATILCMFYSVGGVLLGTFAWILQYWRLLLTVLYFPSILFILYFLIINESVRWLISKGKYKLAIEILRKAAKVNGVTLTDTSMQSLYSNVEEKKDTDCEDNISTIEKQNQAEKIPVKSESNSIKHAFQSPIIRITVLKCSFWWITCTFVYYGLSINAVTLAGNLYLNYILVCLVELPAYLSGFLMMNSLGRKYTLCTSFIVGGIACITFPFLPSEYTWLSSMIYLIGKFFITVAFGSLYVYTSELFPTLYRHSLLGTCSMIGRIGSVVAPQTPLLGEFIPSLPSFLFGGFSFLSGMLMLTSPETLDIKLPDTIEEAERITKGPKHQLESEE